MMRAKLVTMLMVVCTLLLLAVCGAAGSDTEAYANGAARVTSAGGSCSINADCTGGAYCLDGACVRDAAECAVDADCGAGAVCTHDRLCYRVAAGR